MSGSAPAGDTLTRTPVEASAPGDVKPISDRAASAPAEHRRERPRPRRPPTRWQRWLNEHRPVLLRHLHRWHWISAALCLMGMLLFAVTGITLNHAGSIQGRAATLTREAVVPPALVRLLAGDERQERQAKLRLPVELSEWIAREIGAATAGRDAEWSAREIYLALPGPGTDAWITIDRSNGAVLYERTDRGWIAYLNDLHKGRNTGIAWSLFIDLFAVGCIVFCVTGLFLLQLHAQRRPLTWPMVAIGFVAPLLLLMVLVHV